MEDAKGQRAQAKKGNGRGKEIELRQKRAEQLKESGKAIATIEAHIKTTRDDLRTCDALADHSAGFYEEVNKLAKGRVPLLATPLLTQTANDIIRDAKNLVRAKSDVHLERVKEFVPAGDEPSYPEILIVVRSVRDSLKRHRKKLEKQLERRHLKRRIAATVQGALQYFLNDKEASADEKECPTEESVQAYTNGTISSACFEHFSDDYSTLYFDFDKLDSMAFRDYLIAVANESGDDDGEEDSSENLDNEEEQDGDVEGGDASEEEDEEDGEKE